jgi:hypothetical protein
MEYLVIIGIVLLISGIISYFWVRGIDYMHQNHPDYKGEDFLNWDGKNDGWDTITKSAGRDAWDDNTIHSEGDF